MIEGYAAHLETEGYVWRRGALSSETLNKLDAASDMVSKIGARASPVGALADILHKDQSVRRLAEEVGYRPAPVRIVSFDKSNDANWALPWHQDRVIAVHDKTDALEGYKTWSQKAGVWHCEPPISLLEDMVFARIHLDDADEVNGCLELAPHTHRLGKIAADSAQETVAQNRTVPCVAKRGDVLFLKALILHRSRASQNGAPRRAIRVDYSRASLPPELQWAFAR